MRAPIAPRTIFPAELVPLGLNTERVVCNIFFYCMLVFSLWNIYSSQEFLFFSSSLGCVILIAFYFKIDFPTHSLVGENQKRFSKDAHLLWFLINYYYAIFVFLYQEFNYYCYYCIYLFSLNLKFNKKKNRFNRLLFE